ncbi:MAG: UTP--glucose-1-phosphate uridylyltransferase [Candidatus Nealsonbacteria bacterium CG08_land_8_20_14_0_20_43_11]|uniref:UTP--glucose-1-phosphate uridylyltransferase n=1 Tax=Candidatus Nealsonbacteria bacterium CG08_land_8_20_14_0_20_43_11 TaxID=1974706 RepID=A0A2M6T121_9BACT|nr:MAG: UTP--glucose-1-phosphate uridylyltransferase [Candidatus Nealsonbacteria bacterium CG08_land_8_20_14_0_20_43_11]
MSEKNPLPEAGGSLGFNQSVRKVIIPIAGLGSRFLPLSKSVAKELWPLVDLPVIQYIVEEAKASGIREIIFVISPEKKPVLDYFQEAPKIEKVLKERKKTQLLEELKRITDISKEITFSYVFQRQPLGDGHAVLQAVRLVGPEACGVLFADDVVEAGTPCLAQLLKIFKTCQRPVIAIKRVAKERTPFYGIVEVEKIANRLYKIKKIVEKPALGETPSDLAIVGKYVITPEVFGYLERAKPSARGEIIMADSFQEMINDSKVIYGYEFEGEWLECGNKLSWLKSHLYLSLKHQQFGPELKKYLREIKEV